jgi:hypothetical protein
VPDVRWTGSGPERPRLCSVPCRKRAELDARVERRAAVFQASVVDVADRDQILRWLTAAPRLESVSACRILLEELRRDGGSPAGIASVIDELSAKRKGARSSADREPSAAQTPSVEKCRAGVLTQSPRQVCWMRLEFGPGVFGSLDQGSTVRRGAGDGSGGVWREVGMLVV